MLQIMRWALCNATQLHAQGERCTALSISVRQAQTSLKQQVLQSHPAIGSLSLTRVAARVLARLGLVLHEGRVFPQYIPQVQPHILHAHVLLQELQDDGNLAKAPGHSHTACRQTLEARLGEPSTMQNPMHAGMVARVWPAADCCGSGWDMLAMPPSPLTFLPSSAISCGVSLDPHGYTSPSAALSSGSCPSNCPCWACCAWLPMPLPLPSGLLLPACLP